MLHNETAKIETIQAGRIDFYIPLKFETLCNFDELCQKINDTLQETLAEHSARIQSDLQDTCDSVRDNLYLEHHSKLPFIRNLKKLMRNKRTSKRVPSPRANDGTTMEFTPLEHGVELKVNLGEIICYNNRCDDLVFEYEIYEKIYGKRFVNGQQRFPLWPLNIQLNSGEYVWLNPVLCIFENMMGILKLELPLVNVSTQPLREYKYDTYIKSVDNKWVFIPSCSEPTIENLCDAYIRAIVNTASVSIFAQKSIMHNIILARFDGMPTQIQNIPIEIQEDLYAIIAAPVPQRSSVSHKQIAQEYIERHSWGYLDTKYILSATGGCLSIANTALWDHLKASYKKRIKVDKLDKIAIDKIDSVIIRDMCINAEFALIVPILKRMNYAYIYNMKRNTPAAINSAHMKYNINLMFISELQESCYGSVSEQTEFFERSMPYYLKEKLVEEKMHAIDCILAEEKQLRYEKLQNFLSVAGLIMALVFGLPAIYDTIKFIRKLCTFYPYDVPFLTTENTSLGVWFCLVILLSINIFRSRKAKRISI